MAARALLASVLFGAAFAVACGGPAMEILSYTSPVRPGQEAVLTVRAGVLVSCEVTFAYAAGPGEPAGLPAAETDGTGFVSWRWRFAPGTPSQEVTAKASCSCEGETQTDEKRIRVQE
jgi:hypothetical protein